jgi:hypothetical protein
VPKRVLTHDEIMSILRTTVDRLAELSAGLSKDHLHASPAPGEWSISDVLAHLRACNDVLGGNMQRILTEDHPSWRAMSPRTWQKKSGYHDWQFALAFEDFRAKRAELLATLEPVAARDWNRTATVAVPPNKVYEYSVSYYGDWLAAHERAHLRHIERDLKR